MYCEPYWRVVLSVWSALLHCVVSQCEQQIEQNGLTWRCLCTMTARAGELNNIKNEIYGASLA